MSDVRARIADGLVNRLADHGYPMSRDTANDLANTILTLPDIAIVELPQPIHYDRSYECVGRWRVGAAGAVIAYSDGYIIDNTGSQIGSPEVCRQYAAALLAAASAAESASRNCPDCGSTNPERIHYGHCPTIGGR